MKVIAIQEDGLSDAMCYAHKIKKFACKIGDVLQAAFTGSYEEDEDDEDYDYLPVEESYRHRGRRKHFTMGGEVPMRDDERMRDTEYPRHGSRDRGRYDY